MKRILTLFSILSLLYVTSCQKEEKKMPDYLVPEEKMTLIFKDILLLEGRIERLKFGRDTAQQVFDAMQGDIWRKHDVSEEDFKKSHLYYLHHTEDYESIYKALIDTFTLMETRKETRNIKKTNPKKK